jgi:hypothetical protein
MERGLRMLFKRPFLRSTVKLGYNGRGYNV